MTHEDSTGIGYYPFVVDAEAYCMWDWEPMQSNLDFLSNIDPDFFEHIAMLYSPLLKGEKRHYAATALRIAYSQGLETLFALLCATAQAPHCIVGWMHQYANRDLYSVIRKIHNHEKISHCLANEPVSWDSLSMEIHQYLPPEHKMEVSKSFGTLWTRFAEEFLKEDFGKEYNSIKHGLRIRMGGSTIAIGIETTPGVSPPRENMRRLGGSVFGTTFLTKHDLGNKQNFRLKRQSLNWDPVKYVVALSLISYSIGNILSALKASCGVNFSNLQFRVPEDPKSFDAPWETDRSLGLTFSGFNAIIESEDIQIFTKTQIFTEYKRYCRTQVETS